MGNWLAWPKPWVFPLRTKFKYWGILVVAAAVLLALDLIVKSWAAAHLAGAPSRVFIPYILGLTYTRNTGAAFGFLGNFEWGRWVLTIVKIALMAGLLWYYHRLPIGKRFWSLRIPIILIFAGGLGNLYDRITLGYVRDMLAFLFVNFPIFNIADIYVVVGVFVAAFVILFIEKDLPL